MSNEFIPYSESFYETTLSQSMDATTTAMVVATAPTNQCGYLVIEPKSSNREIVKFTSAVAATGALTVVRGLSETSNYDDSAGTGKTHAAGVQVAMKDVHYYFNKVTAAYRGEEVTGYNTFMLGDGAAVSSTNRFWYAACSSVSAFWGLSSNGQLVISEDGVTSWTISAGGSGVTAGDGIKITAGVVDTDLLSTGGLEISAAKLAVEVSSLIARDANGIRVDTTSAMEWSGLQNFSDIAIDGTQISATAAEINQACSGISAYSDVTAYNLSLAVAGINNISMGRISGYQDVSAKGLTGFENLGFQPTFIDFNGLYRDGFTADFVQTSAWMPGGNPDYTRIDGPGRWIAGGTMYGPSHDTENRLMTAQNTRIFAEITSAASQYFDVESVTTSGFTWRVSGTYTIAGNDNWDFVYIAFG